MLPKTVQYLSRLKKPKNSLLNYRFRMLGEVRERQRETERQTERQRETLRVER